ncbi:protein kinase domain-containing protein [Thomasclavelia sp.]
MNICEVYDELEIIKENKYKKISLVRSQIDHLLYLKREIANHNKEIYFQLSKKESRYWPKIFQIQEYDNKIIVIEEYINAPTLEDILLNEAISKERVINIFSQVCYAVQELHQMNPPIIHRDIKPSNIFYENGRVYLFDFDISRNYQLQKNKDTQVLGSVGYAAPEQFGFGQSNSQSDIYALGVLLNVLLINKLPNESIYLGDEEKVIRKATSLDPQQRYLSIKELLDDLNIKEDSSLKEFTYKLPGLNSGNKIKETLLFIGYVMILLFCYNAPVTSNGVLATGITAFLYRTYMYMIIMTIILVTADYLNIHNYCFFSKSNYLILRIFGIILFLFVLLFLELMFISMIIVLFKIG